MTYKTGIGQDSHQFCLTSNKKLILAGVEINNHKGLKANSDGDVILHAFINAISSISTKNILGIIANKMCKQGITNSAKYLQVALQDFNYTINHIAISIECLSPKITPYIQKMRLSIATLTKTNIDNIGITATSGEYLTAFGKGEGIFVTCIISVSN